MATDESLNPSMAKLWGDYEAVCTFCGWLKKFIFSNGMKLQVGDPLPTGGEIDFETCRRCKRQVMKVTKIPELPKPAGPQGFWKVPTE